MKKVNNIQLKNYKKLIYNIRFACEIEAQFPEKVDIETLRTRYRKLLKSWTVVHDHSIGNGLEFKPTNKNKLHFTKECLAEISEVLHIIRKHNGRIDYKTCGLHIHVDSKNLTEEELMKILKEMVARQQFIIRDFKVRPERLDQYCKPITKKDIHGLTTDVLKRFRTDKNYHPEVTILKSKYFLLNFVSLKEFNSIEFRLFNGIAYIRDIKKIIKYVFEFLITALERE